MIKNYMTLFFLSSLCVFNANSQCTTFIIEETDTIYEFNFIQQSIQSPYNGVEFTSYIESNLPLCGANSLNSAGCFQLQLMNPSVSGADYNYADIGFSAASLMLFTEEQWFSDTDNDGCLLSEDCDGDPFGFVLDPSDLISGINNLYDIPILEGTESTLYLVISFYCADDPETSVEEDNFVCQEEVVELITVCNEIVCGDINLDNEITSQDAALILQYVVGLIDLDSVQYIHGDVNNSGNLDTQDAALILQYLVGLPDIFLCSSDSSIDYETEIQPIFDANCVSCHSNGAAYTGGIELTSYDNLMTGGYTTDNTNILFVLEDYISTGYMPAWGTDPLTEAEIELISQWISEGGNP